MLWVLTYRFRAVTRQKAETDRPELISPLLERVRYRTSESVEIDTRSICQSEYLTDSATMGSKAFTSHGVCRQITMALLTERQLDSAALETDGYPIYSSRNLAERIFTVSPSCNS